MIKQIYKYDEVWFTADPHLFHSNIIKMCNRPYTDVNEMWEDFKTKWNSKVKHTDTVFILGDFIWNVSKSKCERIMSQLNGMKVLIVGNHDDENKYDWTYFIHHSRLEFIKVTNQNEETVDMTLCHYPMFSWPGSYRGAIHLYGHVHGKFPVEKGYWNMMDVGFDIKHDLFSYNDIEEILTNQLLNNKNMGL